MKVIYLDHAATTNIDKRVLAKMQPFLTKKYGNPSSLHSVGREAKSAVNKARELVAKYFNCLPEEIIFTGSGTESDNLAIIGAALANQHKGNHIITTKIEHHAVLHACNYLAQNGFEITYLPVDKYGLIDAKQVQEAITDKTILVSVIFANNEVGTVQPIREIATICRFKQILMHSDACQAAGVFDLNVQDLGVDLLTINSNKIYGPKGVGALFIRQGSKITPMIYGGSQEFSKRAGTENVAGIVGMAEALHLAQQERELENIRLIKMRDRLIKELLVAVPKSRLNGHSKQRLPNNVNISFLDVEGESIILHLDARGICVSTGSACTSTDLEASHVLLALGLPDEVAHGSVRLTLGRENTEKDIDYVIKILPQVIAKLRDMSPLSAKLESYTEWF
jgi:cysteine desulfurase